MATTENTPPRPDSLQNNSLAEIILSNIEDGIVLIGNNGRVKIFNPAAERITGLESEKALNRPWPESLKFVDRHGMALAAGDNPLEQVFKQGTSHRFQESYILTPEQRRVPLHLIITPWQDAPDQSGIICVMRDMSLEKEREEAKLDFVSTASHEMRTPLAALEGYLSLILERDLDKQTLEYADKAHQSVMHLGQLFKNLLTTSQSEDGQLSHQPRIVVLNELLKQVIADNRRQAAIKEIELRFIGITGRICPADGDDEREPLYRLNADPQRIQELFNNVLDNAVKYTDIGGQIDISLKEVDQFVQIKIADSGYGVSPHDLPHLFQKFYRVSNKQPGLGLGLFICKQIVDLYGGDIWLESEVGRGSVFYINLPRDDAQSADGDKSDRQTDSDDSISPRPIQPTKPRS